MRKIAIVDWQKPMRMRKGSSTQASPPLPRTPLMLTLTIG
jgi:hypothetical protein